MDTKKYLRAQVAKFDASFKEERKLRRAAEAHYDALQVFKNRSDIENEKLKKRNAELEKENAELKSFHFAIKTALDEMGLTEEFLAIASEIYKGNKKEVA